MKIKTLLLATVISISSFSSFAETVNINKASAKAMQYYLVGVGEVKSQSIIEYRKEHKKFKKVSEIKEVKGIGEAIFKKIKSNLSLNSGVISAPAKITKKLQIKKTAKKKSK